MATNAVAEIDARGKRGCDAVGVIGEAGQETTDATDSDADDQRENKKVAGGAALADTGFHEFHGEETSDETADNGLASHEERKVTPMLQSFCRILEKEEQFAS